ncbi:TerC/Alx family metal homeostasis membrane protein [Winkia sp. ACRQY]|uniref:TerC family integral membrane protein n=2 Tax=Winkia neuii TaxID=33007 RepID=K0YWD1_9ACTO|nr:MULTISPECIES: TerC/Alx family metal homeostasis membrane protein [Winkia]PLB81287.1 tellurium resistance protein TerC [Actinomyces sp. UMB0138]EJZ87976.1 TerC family integral membrane protein [Winkia neuii BV029A5]MBS5947394.1 TerC/Alx family metal homeostasis membrane protein [Winkia neuii]MCG7301925.1 TerC/Alx family metal homeostasis membrane protein [Winkia sp. ACRQY]MDK7162532.1 TerC/Alx family metal homeostasis membrane protein [Winkia sp. UMB3105]
MDVHILGWIGLSAMIIGMIIFDIFAHIRTPHEPTLKEAALWSAIYVGLGLSFALIVWGIWGGSFATEYLAGFLTEKSLSLDNLFVFIIIITGFKVPRRDQQIVLLWGIVIAILARLAFILMGAVIINRFAAVFYLFGAFLAYTAINQAREGVGSLEEEQQEEYKENALTRWARKIFPVTDGFVGDKFFHRHSGKTYLTPMLLCVVAIGSADIMFAMDSIPAIFGLTNEPYLVFATNAFSLLGLRQLYFLIGGLLERLVFLHYGLALILGFIAVKLFLHALHEAPIFGSETWAQALPEPSITFSMGYIIIVIAITTIVSLWYSKKHAK